jgi:hypothetical protein
MTKNSSSKTSSKETEARTDLLSLIYIPKVSLAVPVTVNLDHQVLQVVVEVTILNLKQRITLF